MCVSVMKPPPIVERPLKHNPVPTPRENYIAVNCLCNVCFTACSIDALVDQINHHFQHQPAVQLSKATAFRALKGVKQGRLAKCIWHVSKISDADFKNIELYQ